MLLFWFQKERISIISIVKYTIRSNDYKLKKYTKNPCGKESWTDFFMQKKGKTGEKCRGKEEKELTIECNA